MKEFDVAAVEKVIGKLSVDYPNGPKYVISDADSVSVWYRRSRLFQIGDVVGVMANGYGYYMSFIGQVIVKTNDGAYDVKLLFRHPQHKDNYDGKRIDGRLLWYIDSPELRTFLELEPKAEQKSDPHPCRKRIADFTHLLAKARKKLKRYSDMYVALDELKVSIERAKQNLSTEDMDAVSADVQEALSTVREQVDDIRDGGEMYKELNWDGEEHESNSDEDSSEC